MEAYITILILAVVVSGSLLLLIRYPSLRKVLPLLRWGVQLTKITMDHWGFKRAYSDGVLLGLKYAALAETLTLEGADLREARKAVSSLVADMYKHIYPEGVEFERAKRVAASGYMAVLSHQEIRDTIAGLKDHENLDVRKATYVVIDILGELFDRSDELSKEYFQHLVYGLNKCLVLFKKGGHDRKTLSKIYATLWRIYKLTKAYNKLKANQGLTKKEFYEKLTYIIDGMLRVVGE